MTSGSSPCLAINLPREKENAGRERWLSADELAQLYVELPREWVPLFKLLAETGLRLGEAVVAAHKRGNGGLRWQDVRFAERTIIVRCGGVEATKSHKRRVPVSEGLARVLAMHREAVPAGPQDYVFPAPFTYQAAERIFARVVRRLAWPHTVVHDLRHTFGVHAVMAGVALPRLQKILGHKTPAMTLRYAQHAPEPHAQDDAAKIAASMAGSADGEALAVRELLKVVEA
jgi:integrase